MTRFLFLSDSHFGTDKMGYSQQVAYPVRHAELLDALSSWIRHHAPIDFSSVTGDWKSSDPATVQAFYATSDEYLSGVNKVITRTRDVYSFGEVKLEVLYTHEDPCAKHVFGFCKEFAVDVDSSFLTITPPIRCQSGP